MDKPTAGARVRIIGGHRKLPAHLELHRQFGEAGIVVDRASDTRFVVAKFPGCPIPHQLFEDEVRAIAS